MLINCFRQLRRRRAAVQRRRSPRRWTAARAAEVLECRALLSATLENFLTVEHVDLNAGYNSGSDSWTLQPRNDDESPAVTYDPEEVLLYVGAPALATRPSGAEYDFIGVAGGASYYRLPQSQNPNLLYLGAAGYGISTSLVDRYGITSESKSRLSGSGRWVRFSLIDVQHVTPEGLAGDGIFSVWQSGDTGPVPFLSNFNDGVSNPNSNGLDSTDGISSDDALWILAGGHSHFQYSFSEVGRYEVSLRLSAYLGDNGNSATPNLSGYNESHVITVYFSVTSVGQLEFDSSTYTVDEAAGTASVLVRRVNGSDGRITVDYATANGTAQAGSDYTATSGTLTFEDGQSEKYITVPITNDGVSEGDETVLLSLTNPGPASIADYVASPSGDNSSLLGALTSAVLTITEGGGGGGPTPDIRMVSATADGATTLTVTYEILEAAVDPFDLGVYRSADEAFGGDVLLSTLSITNAADRAVGTHVKTFTIGGGAGQAALPGAGGAEVDTDYFLLFVADPADAIAEANPSNNVVSFVGVYHAPAGLVQVHGGPAADTVSVSSTAVVTVNGTPYPYASSDVTGVRVRAHGGNDTVSASAFTKPLFAFGGDGNDSLTGGTAADLLEGGAGNDALSGGSGSDTYRFDADTQLGSDTLSESTSTTSIDTLDFSSTTTLGVTLNLGLTTAQVVNSNLTLTLMSGTLFENIIGGALADTLTGNSAANALTGGGGNDVLAGGAGSDTYLFDADSPLGSDTIIESASGGTDTLDFSATTTLGVTVNLGLTSSQVVNANLTLTLSSAVDVENVFGGSQADTLTGNSANNTITGGPGNDTLAGAAGSDIYRFDADGPLGSDTIVELTGGGTDTLDFSPTTTLGVTVHLGLTTSQVVNTNLTLTLSAADTIENLIGGSKDDTLTGNALANVLTGGNGNDTLAGGAGNDTYKFDADTPLGSDTLVEVADGGTDLIDFTGTTTQAVSLNLSQAATQVVNGNLMLTLGAGDVFENITGSTRDDTLTGNGLANALSGGSGNDTLDGGAGNDTLTGGSGNDTLTGGSGDDTYRFDADGALGSDTIIELVGGGTDTLDFALTTTQAVTVNLSIAAAQVVHGNLTLTLGAGDVIENLIGGSKDDSLTGNALANRLTGGGGNDTLSGLAGNDVLIGGGGNDTLNGGDGDDTYVFDADAALGSDNLSDSSGVDLLDFSATTAQSISLDLASTAAQVVNTYLTLTLASGASIEMVIGGSKNDTLLGNSLNNVLFGGGGSDAIDGRGGRDLLVGGAGPDSLIGGDDDDLLLSGTVSYYNETTKILNRAAIDAIMAEWARGDLGYAARISNLRNGGGLNGSNTLNSLTVLSDGTAIDTLTGSAGLDWFWSFGSDAISDLNSGGAETVN